MNFAVRGFEAEVAWLPVVGVAEEGVWRDSKKPARDAAAAVEIVVLSLLEDELRG